MGWQERDWAKRKDDSPRERVIERELEGAFPSPIREDSTWEKAGNDDGHGNACSYAGCVELADMVRGKVGDYLAKHEIKNLQEAGGFVEMLHKLVIAAHNARHLDSGAPPKEDDDDEIDSDDEE